MIDHRAPARAMPCFSCAGAANDTATFLKIVPDLTCEVAFAAD